MRVTVTSRKNWVPNAALVDAGLLLLLALCVISVAVGVTGVRPLVVLLTAAFVPGAGLLTLFPVGDLTTAAALAIALSLTLETVGSLILVWVGWWHPDVLGGVLATLSGLLLVCDLAITASFRRRTATESSEWR
jgi:uncharacterized membrane protein